MPRHPIELARKHYEELPAVLKQALFSVEIAEQMFEIGKKFGLTIEKTGIMAEESGYVILGLARPNELVGNLANELGLDANKAQDIAAEINHQIFFPLREELKRTHDFDMEIALSAPLTIGKTAGMPMPETIKKTLVEEKSPLVSDLTRIKETNTPVPTTPTRPPSFQPPASPTGRIDDLRKMVEKPPLPVGNPITPSIPAPKPLIAKPKEVPEIPASFPKPTPKPPAASTVEPWEKDLEKEVSSLLKPLPIDLHPIQKPAAPPPMPVQPGQPGGQSKLPPIDLRPTTTPPPPAVSAVEPPPPAPPSVPRMTPQMQDLVRPIQLNTTPTLLEENMKKAELKEKTAPPKSIPTADPISPPSATINTVAIGDPYREPIEEDQP